MCGRYATYKLSWSEIVDLSRLSVPSVDQELKPNYNVCPTHRMPIIIIQDGSPIGATGVWGLIPPWWKKDLKEKKFPTFNARSETVAEKASFRASWRSYRCLVPANVFYEWEHDENGKKTGKVFAIGVAGDDQYGMQPYMFGGLYCHWKGLKGGEPFEGYSFTLVTRDAGEEISKLHHREPVILLPEEHEQWLLGSTDDATELCNGTFPNQLVKTFEVSKSVGSTKINQIELLDKEWSHLNA